MATLKLNTKTLAPQTSSAEPVLASNVTGGGGLTALGTVTTGTIGGSTIVNTSGAVTTTGAFTSQGIDDNSTGTTGLTIASDGKITQNVAQSYQGGILNWDFSFTGQNTTAVDFDLTVPDIGYFELRSGFGSEQGIAGYHVLHIQGNHNGTSTSVQNMTVHSDTLSNAIGNWTYSKTTSTNFRLSKSGGTYTNYIHGFVHFSTTTS